jgi:hypothetical protein
VLAAGAALSCEKEGRKNPVVVSREATRRLTKLPEWPLLSWHPYRKNREKGSKRQRDDARNQQRNLTGEATSSALGASAAGAEDSVAGAGAVSVGLTSSTGTGVAVASTVDITIEIKGN